MAKPARKLVVLFRRHSMKESLGTNKEYDATPHDLEQKQFGFAKQEMDLETGGIQGRVCVGK